MEFTGGLFTLVSLVASWFVYIKMGRQGWEGIIPIYNVYVLFEELYGNGWMFLTLLIPFYNIYVIIRLNIDLAHKFGQSTGFGWGLVLLNPVFMCIMAFSSNIQCEDGQYYDVGSDFTRFTARDNSDADALLKYKQLYDEGVITEEEFNRKKDEILNR